MYTGPVVVNFYEDNLTDGTHILEWEEDGYRFGMSEWGNREPGLVSPAGIASFTTWNNWEIAL